MAFEGASLRQIAATAGVDRVLAAHHFGSKEGLWKAVIEEMTAYLAPYKTCTSERRGRRLML